MSNFTATALEMEGLLVITPTIVRDHRGFFMETYNARAFLNLGIETCFIQDNQSFSAAAGTIRGLHFQRPPFAQAKLVRVVRGARSSMSPLMSDGTRRPMAGGLPSG